MPPKNLASNSLIDIEKIKGILPHRYPFLLVDRVLELKKGESLVAIKNVTVNEPFFQGHFPQLKIMPGVLIVEALAQAGGILVYYSLDEPENKLLVLSKIERARFRKPVTPGDQLRLEVKLLRLRLGVCQVEGKAYVGEELAVEGVVTATLVDMGK
ncbi:MAG: 3-hydroxyacyl-[acyl-carrier-protein] dehydratase FabZ [Candidatus Aminicenantes bacterium]|nr:MAG: 3-hydroxyacyl-[acyl-carrier-protein] dehydratase FabZ [Candidatus Aminicenantes bacterium]